MATGTELYKNAESFSPSYALTEQQAQELCDYFIGVHEADLAEEEISAWPDYGCYSIDGADPMSDMGRYVEAQARRDSFGVTPDQLASEYTSEYEHDSKFLVVIDHQQRRPIGMLRMTRSSEDDPEIKTLADLEKLKGIPSEAVYHELDTSKEDILDIGAFAVLPNPQDKKNDNLAEIDNFTGEQTKSSPALILFRGLYHHLAANPRISHIVGLANQPIESILEELKIPSSPILGMEPFKYGNLPKISENKSNLVRGISIPASEIFTQLHQWHEDYKLKYALFSNYVEILNSSGDQEIGKDIEANSKRFATLAMKIGALIDPFTNDLDKKLAPEITRGSGIVISRSVVEASNIPEPDIKEVQLMSRFEPQRISKMARDFLINGPYGDIRGQIKGKQYAAIVVSATDPRFADLGKAPETVVFAGRFERTFSQVHDEYAVHDPNSEFIVVLDVRDTEWPVPAGTIRMMHGNTINDLKSIKDLVVDSPDNPWRDELAEMLFEAGESYDAKVAWERLCSRNGVTLNPEESSDVATLSVFPNYGRQDSLNGVSVLLYHSCAKLAISKGMKNLLSIQDVEPFNRLQSFAQPFDTFKGVKPHPYGGPYDTIPAYCVIDESTPRVRKNDNFMASILVDGQGISKYALLLQDLDPETFGKRPRTTAKFMIQATIRKAKSARKSSRRK